MRSLASDLTVEAQRSTHPWFVAGQAQTDSNTGHLRVDDRVVVRVAMVADSDRCVVRLVDAVEDVDWFWEKIERNHARDSNQLKPDSIHNSISPCALTQTVKKIKKKNCQAIDQCTQCGLNLNPLSAI